MCGLVGVTRSVFTSLYWKRILNGRMIVDIELPCIPNRVVFSQLFQGHKVMPADFLLAVKRLFRRRPRSMESPCITFILSLPKNPQG